MSVVGTGPKRGRKPQPVLTVVVQEKVCFCKIIQGICMRCKAEWKQHDPRPPGPSRSKSFRKVMASTFKRYNQKKGENYNG